jgi:hypothetical protein
MPPIEAPAAPAEKAGASEGSEQRVLPTEEEMLASYEAKQGGENAGAADQQAGGDQAKPAAKVEKPPEEDPDGDSVFEREFKEFRMPDGVKTRLKRLTEQRNLTRTELTTIKEQLEKDYGFFKPYANEKGKAYLSTLVQFDERLEVALESNPWLQDLIKDVVVGGKAADKKKLLAALSQIESGDADGAAPEGGAPDPASDDPRDKQLRDLVEWKKGQEEKQRQGTELAQRRTQVDREKENYRTEIAEFESRNPQFKGDKSFIRLALQISASRNVSFTEAAKEMADYMGGREKSALTKLAKVDEERGGAQVETPGRGGVPRKERPAIGSDEEAEQMDAYFDDLTKR